jgi:AcrR family transcriptional regulator
MKYNVKTPRHIVETASRIFAERGYRAVRLKDIVRAARVNCAAVNYHFGDKDQLYREVVRHNLAMREQLAPIDEPEDRRLPPELRLRKFIHVLMVQLLDDRIPSVMPRLMLWEAVDPTPVFGEAVEHLPKRQLKILDEIISSLSGRKLPRTMIRRCSISILGQCVFYRYAKSVLEHIDSDRGVSARNVDAIAGHIYSFSMAGILRLAGARDAAVHSRRADRSARAQSATKQKMASPVPAA